MHNRSIASTALVAIVAAAVSATACSDSDRVTPTGPGRVDSQQRGTPSAVAVQPTLLFRRSIRGAVCPVRPPFFVPFDLLLRGAAETPLFLHQVRLQFVDSFGTAGPQLTIPQPDLTTRFPSLQIPRRGSRIFPFSFEFGCATGPTGTLIVIVRTSDPAGRMHQGAASVSVR